jgi:hypothetical protein
MFIVIACNNLKVGQIEFREIRQIKIAANKPFRKQLVKNLLCSQKEFLQDAVLLFEF